MNLAKIRKYLIGDRSDLAESRYWLTGEAGDKDGLPGDEDWLITKLSGEQRWAYRPPR
jgi:hypothetical protein